MLRGLFAGAGCFALLDLLIRIPLAAPGFWRETALLACSGAVGIAALAALLLAALRRARGLGAVEPATAFWIGFTLAAVPAFGALLPKRIFGLALALVFLPLAGRLGRRLRMSGPLTWLLAAVPVVVAPVTLLLPSAPLPALPPAPPAPAAGPAVGPDVLLISCDTLRADSLDELAGQLPHLEALRARGRWASYGLAPSSSTRPSHTTMLSGLPAVAHAVKDNQWKMGEGVRLVSERFQEAGWRTAAVISNAMISSTAGFDRGFEVFDETPIVRRHFRNEELSASHFSLDGFIRAAKRGTWVGWLGLYTPALEDWILHDWKGLTPNRGNGQVSVDRSLALMRELQEGEAPYFLFVHLMDPHTPYVPPEAYHGRAGRAEAVPEAYQAGEYGPGDWTVVNKIGEALAAGDPEAAAFLEQVRQLYLEEVVYVDAVLGQLLAQAEAGGRQAVVLFTSDHGEHFGEHGLVLHSNSLYEPLLRVPFILAGPGVEAGEFGTPPQLEDVAPTLLSLAGLSRKGLVGRDLSAGPLTPRPHVERFHEFLAVRKGAWKLILTEDEQGEFHPTGLYQLELDPGEERNLLEEDPPEKADLLRLAAAAVEAEKAAAAGAVLDTDAAHHEAMQELGYADY